MFVRKTLATFVFEFSRSLTTSRIATSLVLALFAQVMLVLIGFTVDINGTRYQIPFPLFVLSIFHLLALFLAVLLWATPVVYSELEGKTWSYLSVRPYGKFCSTLGKYLNAVAWAVLTTTLSLTASCLVISYFVWDVSFFVDNQIRPPEDVAKQIREGLNNANSPVVIWYSLFPCLILGAFAFSAIFVHIGLLAHKRGMVFAVIYGIVETAFSFLPAIVRQLTIGFHLRNIGLKTSNLDVSALPPQFSNILATETAIWVHVLALLIITAIHLGLAIYWLHSREYITAEEV